MVLANQDSARERSRGVENTRSPPSAELPKSHRRHVGAAQRGGEKKSTFSGLTSMCTTGGSRACMCATARATHAHARSASTSGRPPRRRARSARLSSPRSITSSAARGGAVARAFLLSSSLVFGGTSTSCAWRVTTSSCADTEACTSPSWRASASESSGGSRHCFSASGADEGGWTVPSPPSSRVPGPPGTLEQRYTRAAPPSANIAPTRNVRPATTTCVPARSFGSLRAADARGFTAASTSRSAFRNRSIGRGDARERGSAPPSGRHAAWTLADARPETRRRRVADPPASTAAPRARVWSFVEMSCLRF